MNISRRQKYANSGRSISKTDKKIDINFDLESLNLMCSYVISENRNIRNGALLNMRNLFEIIDLGNYSNDMEKLKRVNFIRKGLEGRLLKGLKNPTLIIKYINGGILDENIIDLGNLNLLSTDELQWVNETVSEALKYAFMYNDIDNMLDICTRFKAADFRSKGEIVKEYEEAIKGSMNKFRRSNVESLSEMTFTLRDGLFEEVIKDAHEALTNPNNKLITGMQGINELLGGGFECSRVYLVLGLTGGGKSLTLLNIAKQIKKYNKNYQPKDPTKIPVILYITMENNVRETIERMFNMISPNTNLNEISADDMINILRTDGELYLNGDDPIDILIKFVPDRSVDTSYLYTVTEDLEDEGYEVICVIQDHIKKIRSVFPQSDIRLELGSIMNEFKTFCAIKDIPLITNSHLNREAAKTVDEGKRHNKADLTRLLGRANVGESMLMLDNVDCGFLIGAEYDSDGNKYMAFNRIKMRYKATNRDFICQPFIKGNDIRLLEDMYLAVPAFKESLKDGVAESDLYKSPLQQRSPYQNNIKDIDDVIRKDNIFDDENIFSNPINKYSSIPIEEEEQEENVKWTMDMEINKNQMAAMVVGGNTYKPVKEMICPVSFVD